MEHIILVAGATGNLGMRIVQALAGSGVELRAAVRNGSDAAKISQLESCGVKVYHIGQWSKAELQVACRDVTCVVSVLAGLRDVIIDAQTILLDAAIEAGVPRFIPSDYSLDFTPFKPGENRNLDLRREFHLYLDSSRIAATSVFNGAFTELLTHEMPMILFKQKRILYWGDADCKWGFTTMNDTARYTAQVALDKSAPRYLRIAGDQVTPIQVKTVVSEVMGTPFRMFRPGGQKLLGMMIKIARFFSPGKNELYPAWQGMQYMHNMIDKRAVLAKTDNDRYPGMVWTTVKDVLVQYKAGLTGNTSNKN